MAAVIHDEPRICERRLKQLFDSTPAQWIEIVKAAVAARASCTDDHAKAAPGFYAWNAGTARARQIFRPQGWERGDDGGIETIVHHDFKKIVAVLNTDAGTADSSRSPKNRTPKGPASEKVVDLNNQFEMFKPTEVRPPSEWPYSRWYLCIYDDGAKVRAELSRPIEYAAGYIVGFSERIFILRDGDWEKVVLDQRDRDHGDELEISVRRK